ncbi:hypothetical protein A3I27_00655 [Candidatus Giovannonibacteria bacterium RIFCSPLOWO2_02_FULL_43_11b]|uniref:VTT domain-containing protein n=1 Tax=Candidatus Giovannonibacteria bacterium RIFCSPHIGHO2_12_FULL_43_15 TaxID=1798341 RepID=A0A1F5WPS3_9BACT|nr:MAG: hypothetical protein A3B97_01345 [Candidatus Giovannonibacteria bacterium RIFCSPHIGHO2_02_FULL_43_32]OGF77604.1 MAG: hypothetical protein A3F23_00160 [Candidatus Giovannonibacteria bacterium RIFCSPHIGHO2_12_FULL_43_15]OGF79279.1 MAG: hypothetical protein A3A15_01415 [Candidatus Giovannonibacteria bacterium RIFCSPLOWO2_01_FULL_43_60]OGF90164.1 MAG: hypothetical protein A3I27_00655 [Candidatus Giovannonibacteria bacterium RIFCSPLOWO2_02_FULL_43_11b]OGF92238.1 MAG: hypothetical protein A3H
MFSVAQIIGWLLLYRYVALFSVVAIEGPISTLIAGYLSSLGLLNFWIAYVVAVSGDLASDAGYYALGRFGRERFVKKYGHYVGITSDKIVALEKHFEKHGGKMLVFGKIADPLSSTIQTLSGMTMMRFSIYASYNTAATVLKSFILISVGYYFGEALHQADIIRRTVGIAASVIGILVVSVYFIYRKVKQEELLEKDG